MNDIPIILEFIFYYSPVIALFILAGTISKKSKKNSRKNSLPVISSVFYAFALLIAILPTTWLAMVILGVSD